jgi:diguanylate cyclase (GGDEF)-like protein
MGFEIAIDDLGAGYAGLRMWSELRPDYVKIDRHFMQDIHEDRVKQEFVRSIQDIARSLKCRVIAEGVETADELRVVNQLGLDLLQGYYFARPSHSPPTQLNEQLFNSDMTARERRTRVGLFSHTVGELLQPVPSIVASLQLESVAEIFACSPNIESLPVVEHERPLGLVRRGRLMNLLLTRYGRELHGKKPVAHFLQSQVLMLESLLPIEKASHLVTEQMKQDKALDFMITENGLYRGMGSVIDLLQVITDVQVRNARHANPLTLLPGNVPIYEELDELLKHNSPFVFAYCDLDNFKPYNDKYGYEKGDQIIKLLAEIILAETDPATDFVGHVGGDDFVIIMQSEDWHARCENILQKFAERRQHYYQQEDLLEGGIWSESRGGERQFFPLLSLSIGCVQPDAKLCRSHHDIAALAAGAKHQAKKQLGNSLYVDQRRRPETLSLKEKIA